MVAVSAFPSDFFISDGCFRCQQHTLGAGAEHIEFYPLESLVSFLFSPIGQGSRQEKAQILERMLGHFQSGISRRVYFIPCHLHTRFKMPNLQMSPAAEQVTFLFPENGGNFSFVEINNKALSEAIQLYYQQSATLIHEGLVLLQIALKTLNTGHGDTPLADIQLFYRQCVQRLGCAEWVKACFTPEVQATLMV